MNKPPGTTENRGLQLDNTRNYFYFVHCLLPKPMKISTLTPVLAILLITSITACKKNIDAVTPAGNGVDGIDTSHQVKTDTGYRVTFPLSKLTGCPGAPDYGDSIFFVQPTSSTDYIIQPINHPDTGTYFAWPQGMIINK
ncbi:MAG: hypothetical protein ABJC98_22715, partial [Bacteroidota bacterium]